MGVAGAVVGVALRLGQLRGNMTKSHRMASRASWQEKRCDTMAMPPQIVVRRRHCTWFWHQWDYPQRSYTRPHALDWEICLPALAERHDDRCMTDATDSQHLDGFSFTNLTKIQTLTLLKS